ncbi:MAG: hypothetical protein RL022_1848, partial [Chloroflexota bacterium]
PSLLNGSLLAYSNADASSIPVASTPCKQFAAEHHRHPIAPDVNTLRLAHPVAFPDYPPCLVSQTREGRGLATRTLFRLQARQLDSGPAEILPPWVPCPQSTPVVPWRAPVACLLCSCASLPETSRYEDHRPHRDRDAPRAEGGGFRHGRRRTSTTHPRRGATWWTQPVPS